MDHDITDCLDEHVVTLSLLGSRLSAQKSQSMVRKSLTDTENKWCCVLDELSWLCDYRTGGKTVTSIAAQSTPEGNIFWFANNKKLQLPIQRHLQWILQELHSHTVDGERNTQKTRWKLFRKSIVFNHRRVEFYYNQLASLLKCIKQRSDRQRDPSLIGHLERLMILRDNHEDLCILAFELREGALGTQLRQCVRDSQMGSVWQAVRHYIGRLSSWWSACAILASVAESHPQMFLNCQLKAVVYEGKMTTELSQEDNGCLLLRSTSRRPEEEQEEDQSRSFQHLRVNQRVDIAGLEFVRGLAQRRGGTYVHAELLVLNHFHRRNFTFAEDVPYIGCSKLSCYCCQLYMEIHPRAMLSRPCHGNTWVRWAMPVLRVDRNGKYSGQDIRLLVSMIRLMQQEIKTGLLTGGMNRQLESTTGISG